MVAKRMLVSRGLPALMDEYVGKEGEEKSDGK